MHGLYVCSRHHVCMADGRVLNSEKRSNPLWAGWGRALGQTLVGARNHLDKGLYPHGKTLSRGGDAAFCQITLDSLSCYSGKHHSDSTVVVNTYTIGHCSCLRSSLSVYRALDNNLRMLHVA